MNQKQLSRLFAQVRKYIPSWMDHEDIAIAIWLESSQKGHDIPSREFIHHRAVDYIRKENAIRRAQMFGAHRDEIPNEVGRVFESNEVDRLVGGLNPQERKIIWYRFYKGQTINEIATTLKVKPSLVSDILDLAIHKMRGMVKE